jgi:hypothetical protein
MGARENVVAGQLQNGLWRIECRSAYRAMSDMPSDILVTSSCNIQRRRKENLNIHLAKTNVSFKIS